MIIDSIVLPFVGSRVEDHVCFEYLLQEIGPEQARFMIPRWVVNREVIRRGDRVHFHLPFRLNQNSFSCGTVTEALWNASIGAQVFEARLETGTQETSPPFITLEPQGTHLGLKEFSAPVDLPFRVLKDSALLKKGVLIYLDHLIPYFSRISGYPVADYPRLRNFVLKDIREKVKDHHAKLEAYAEVFRQNLHTQADIPLWVDLEELRAVMESEILTDLFRITFESRKVVSYLAAIKELENKLYSNYNTVVMLHIKSL